MVCAMSDCWAERMVLTRASPRASKMAVKAAVMRAVYIAVNWVG